MNREKIDSWCERGILGLVLAILVYGPLGLGAVRGLEFGIIQGLTAGVLLLWVARLWVNPRPQLLWPPICWAVIAFALYAIWRYTAADIEYLARQELFKVLVYTFLFFAILNNLHRQESTQIISFTLIFLGMAIAFYAGYQFLTNSDRVWHFIKPYPHRGSGTYICPNHLAGFLGMLVPLGLAYTLAGRLKPVTKIFVGYASLALLAGIAASISRGGIFATAVALGLLFVCLLFNRNHRLPALVLLVMLMGAGWILTPKSYMLQARWRELQTQMEYSHEDMRFALWGPALRMWQEHFWWGVGPAHFDARFRQYRPEGVQASPNRAHNDYLNTLADWGVAGTLLVASAWALLGYGVAKTWRSVRLSSGDLGGKIGSNKFAFVLGASLGLLALLIHSFVDFNMHVPANAILAITLMALLSSHVRFATQQWWFRAPIWTRALLSIVLLAGIGSLAAQGWREAAEFLWLQRAAQAPVFSATQVQLLRRAFAVEPKNGQTAVAIADAWRQQSAEGGEFYLGQEGMDYRKLALEAMKWYALAMKLNPWDSRSFSGYGWCLDWLERPGESEPYFSKAEELDPNNYFNLNRIGVHYVEAGNYAAAKPWFERSLHLKWEENPIAENYLKIANTRLIEAATNQLSARVEILPK